jgi:hypothetical protein
MKILISSLLAGVLTLGLAAPISASTSPQERFMRALDETYGQLSREFEIANAHTKELMDIIDVLAQAAYEMSVEFSVDFLDETMGITSVFRSEESANRFSTATSLFGFMPLFLQPDRTFNTYFSDERSAVGSPSTSNRYFYLPNDITPAQWANTGLGQSGADLAQITHDIQMLSTLGGALNMNISNANLEFPDGLLDPYVDIFRRSLENASFRSDGEQLVRAQRGNLRTQRLVASLSAEQVTACLIEIATTLETDQTLRAYLIDTLFPATTPVEMSQFEMGAMVGAGIGGVAQVLRSVAAGFDGELELGLNIASNGMAVRQTLNLGLGDIFGTGVQLTLDMMGRDFLINELALNLRAGSAWQYATINLSQIGNIIMRGNILEGVSAMRIEFGDMFAELSYDYFWDANRDADNFRADLVLEVDAPAIGLPGVLHATMALEGDYSQNATNNTMLMDIVATGNWGELLGDPNATGRFVLDLRPINPNDIGIPGSGVNLADVSAEDEDLLLEFVQIFQ